MYERIEKFYDIKLMYILILTIDKSYLFNMIYRNNFSDLEIVIANFLLNMIY
jgi:hypothetical protein